MKVLMLVLATIGASALITLFVYRYAGEVTDKSSIRQYVVEANLLCPSGTCVATYIRCEGEIVKSFYDDLETSSDSLLKARITEGEEIIKKCKRIDNR